MAFGTKRQSNQVLTNVSVKYTNEEFIAEEIFPRLNVTKNQDRIRVWNSEFRIPQTVRAAGAAAEGYTHSWSFTTYNLTEHALSDTVTDDERENAEPGMSPDIDATNNLTDKIMLRKEWEAQVVAFTTTTWGNNTTLASTTSWRYNTTTSSDPAINGSSATAAVIAASGKTPNRVLLGFPTRQLLRDNVNLIERIKYSERGIITDDILAALWDVPTGGVVVGKAIYDQALEGLTVSQTAIWQNNALWYFKPATVGPLQASSGYIVTNRSGRITKKWREEKLASDMIEVSDKFQVRAIATATAHLYADVDV